jgi:transposase
MSLAIRALISHAMNIGLAAFPDDIDAPHRLICDLTAERSDERAALCQVQAEIERLRLIVQKLQRPPVRSACRAPQWRPAGAGLEDLDADIARAEERVPHTSVMLGLTYKFGH